MSAPYSHHDDERMSASEWQAYLRSRDDDALEYIVYYGAMQSERADARDERDRREYEVRGD